ncbi:MAG: HepT-like ribonuclease domain-containing protein [Pseudomonadota bacterium]
MPKDDLVYVGHMLDMATKAIDLVSGKTRKDFDRDEPLRLALTYLVQVVGEAARRVSSKTVKEHPEIPWKAIVGMRHKVVHNYMGVDEDVLWDTVTHELLPLVKDLKKLCS